MIRPALVLALCACGDNLVAGPDEGPDPRSGERLAVLWYAYDDGTRQPEPSRFYDLERGERCAVVTWSDGLRYCTPEADGGTAFADAACTNEIGFVTTGVSDPRYVIRSFSQDGAPRTSRLFRLGRQLPHAEIVYERRGDACEPMNLGLVTLYELAGEIPHDGLARIRELEIDGTDRLGLTLLASDDGMRMPASVRDRELDVRCEPDLLATAVTPCVPESIMATYFQDAACTVAEVSASPSTPPSTIVSVATVDGCAVHHRLGTHVGPVPLFRREGSSCVPTTASGEYLYLAGERVEPASIDTRVLARSGGRLRDVALDLGALTVRTDMLFDSVTNTLCRRSELFGTQRCLPVLASARAGWFAEPTCRTPVLATELSVSTCASQPRFATMRAPEVTIYEIGGVLDTAYVRSADGGCVRYEAPPNVELHALGPGVGLASFPEATLVGP